MLQNNHELTQDNILKLAKDNVIVRCYVSLWLNKELTWEQANYGIILALVEYSSEIRLRSIELVDKKQQVLLISRSKISLVDETTKQ